jgi:general secretion pathway protein G
MGLDAPIRVARSRGFTLIELLAVLATVGLLLGIVVPRYLRHVDQAREVTLKHNLTGVRDSIDKFYADRGRYPSDLQELVQANYLRALPLDPVTNRVDSWKVQMAPEGGVRDIHSGAQGNSYDGTPYATW